LQGDVIEDLPNKSVSECTKEEIKDIDMVYQALIDSGTNVQDDGCRDPNKSTDKQKIIKPAVVLTPEEIKDKLDKHIEDIDSKMDVRLKITKRMLIREMDAKLMSSLSKAVKMKREKSPTVFNSKIRRTKNSSNKLPPLNPAN
jgi:hypothetical protein